MKSDTPAIRTAALIALAATVLLIGWTFLASPLAFVVARASKIRRTVDTALRPGARPDVPPADAGQPVTIQIDTMAKRHPISPLVYGVSYVGDNAAALNCPIDRMGGNNTTRYNWRENADNRANDWFFESIADPDATPGGRVSKFIAKDAKTHTATMVTVPLIGWVAHVNDDRSKRWSFSKEKYGPQQGSEGDAGDGKTPAGKFVTGNDPHDANVRSNPEFMRPWIEKLTQDFGKSSAGNGVGFYLLDNEPGIWHTTHRDVMPIGIMRDEQFAKSRDMALMIKTVDPSALIVGPEEWGWTGYQYSGFDSQWGGTHGWGGSFPDRDSHGGMEMAPWLLAEFAKAQRTTGKRLLDVFSLHYYPQGGEFSGDISDAMQLRRNRSTRSLWDPNYLDESWIADKVRLVPRMKQWVAENYPETKTALTEYCWGADESINGATAQADILGILGREGIDIANRWVCPDPKTPTFKAMQLFRNYDGHNNGFGDLSVGCEAPDPDAVSAFAAANTKTGAVTVVVIAKTAHVNATKVTLSLRHFPAAATAHAWQLTSANAITALPDSVVTGGSSLDITVPAQSVTLIVLPRAPK